MRVKWRGLVSTFVDILSNNLMACSLQFAGFEEMHRQLMVTYMSHVPTSTFVHGAEPFLNFAHKLITNDLGYSFVYHDIPDLILGLCLRDILCGTLSLAGAETSPTLTSLFNSCRFIMDALGDALRNDHIISLVWPFIVRLMAQISSDRLINERGSAGAPENNVTTDLAQEAVDLLESVCPYYLGFWISQFILGDRSVIGLSSPANQILSIQIQVFVTASFSGCVKSATSCRLLCLLKVLKVSVVMR
jgi:hypothetical protein